MKEIVVTKCGPDEYYIIDGAELFEDGQSTPRVALEGKTELLGYKIKEVTRLHIEVDATIVVDVDVEGDEDAAFERAAEITQAFETETEKITLLGEDSVGLGVAEPIFWRNEDSGEETYR